MLKFVFIIFCKENNSYINKENNKKIVKISLYFSIKLHC